MIYQRIRYFDIIRGFEAERLSMWDAEHQEHAAIIEASSGKRCRQDREKALEHLMDRVAEANEAARARGVVVGD